MDEVVSNDGDDNGNGDCDGDDGDGSPSNNDDDSSEWEELYACPLCDTPCHSPRDLEVHVLTACPQYSHDMDVTELLKAVLGNDDVIVVQ